MFIILTGCKLRVCFIYQAVSDPSQDVTVPPSEAWFRVCPNLVAVEILNIFNCGHLEKSERKKNV